jgi:hypothetical protein
MKTTTINKVSRSAMPDAGALVFTFIAFCLTIISAYNGFKFYNTLFGLFMAVMISATFEVSRFACLFRYRNSQKRVGVLTLILYTITAIVCAFASINSFTAEVVRRNRLNEKEVQAKIYEIKKAYSEKAIEKITSLNKNIKYLENQVAKYPESNYWKRRLAQYVLNLDKEIAERDRFLQTNPDNPEQWLRAQAPLLGLEIKTLSLESEAMTSVKHALNEVWGLSNVTTQKLIGTVVTVTVELCILLFVILATERRKSESLLKRITEKRNLPETLRFNFGESQVKRFLSISRKHFERTGELPPMRRLNTTLRPILEYLKDIDRESLQGIFQK